RNAGMGIILTTHLMDDAERLADYVYIIDAGRNVTEGTVAELLRHETARGEGINERALYFDAAPGLDFAGVLRDGVTVRETRAGSYSVSGALVPGDLAALAACWAERNLMPSSMRME